MIRTILLVINPIAGDKDKDSMVESLKQEAAKLDVSLILYYTTGDNDHEAIENIASKNNPDLIIAMGGDGTFNLVANIAIEKKYKMSILPAGSANGMARELNIPNNMANPLEELVNGEVITLDAVKINNSFISIHLSDIGLNARVIKRFSNDNLRGFMGYARQYFREMKDITSTKFEITTDMGKFNHSALMVVIANSTMYGTGATINPLGNPNDGLFELVIIKPYPITAFFKLLIAFFTNSLHKLEYVNVIHCKEAVIISKKPEDLQIDGETKGKFTKVTAKIIPQALSLVVPKNL